MNLFKWSISLMLLAPWQVASGETVHSQHVTIEFERSSFAFDRDDGVSIVPIAAETVSITTVLNGIDLNFNDQLLLSDFATGESDPQLEVRANFHAGFSFIPDAGQVITGYRATVYGTYDIETPGDVGVDVSGRGFSATSGGNGAFSETYEWSGPIAPALVGSISALGRVDFMEVAVGTQSVYVRSDFIPDPACTEPDLSNCPLIEIPVYEEVTLYVQQADLGAASVNLQGIRLEAVVIPEPSVMSGAIGLLGLGLTRMRHRRRTV